MSRVIPVEYVRECFDVDAAGVLYWKSRPAHHFSAKGRKEWTERFVGKPAGRVNGTGYYVVGIAFKGKSYKVLNHRIVWALMHGEWPKQVIDHINRVPTDNRPENLRDVSVAVNANNKAKGFRENMPVGVYRYGRRKYRTQLTRRSTLYYFGTFVTQDEAAAAVAIGRQQLDNPASHVIDGQKARIAGQHLIAANDRSVEFEVGGARYSLESMLEANGDDPEVCEWLRSAAAGDVYDRMHSELVVATAA